MWMRRRMMLIRMEMNWCQNCFCHRFYDVSLKYLSLLGWFLKCRVSLKRLPMVPLCHS